MSDVDMSTRTGAGGSIVQKVGATPYVAAVFLSASLVFLVQPMFAKMATPLLGGAPAVWNVALVCFQSALLAGYAYAHGLARLKSIKAQVLIHAVLLAVAALALPLSISGLLGTPDPSQPVLWLAGTFLLSIAPPFAIISATAPLIQNWYARSGHPDAADPYHLYAASNVGSLVGLAAYPLLMEPFSTVSQQTTLWAVGYGELAVLLVGCGLLAVFGNRMGQVHVPSGPVALPAPTRSGAIWRERFMWLLLAAVPSGLLLSVTTHISTDIASAPFIWAPPLMAYIGTFIIVFSKKPLISTVTATRYLPHALVLLAIQAMLQPPLLISFGIHVLTLFVVALCLHGTLADRRPSTERLTEFYLVMSVGGVIGAAFPALLAPLIFNGVYEYPLMLAAALLMRPAQMNFRESLASGRVALFAIAAITIVFVVMAHVGIFLPRIVYLCAVAVALSIAILNGQSRLIPFAAMIGALVIGLSASPARNLVRERGFFGVISTREKPEWNARIMVHGTTIHGAQFLDGAERLTPLTYYHPRTPIGQVFLTAGKTARNVGVVGLGVGSVACYSHPGQALTFYEIDPIVARIAKDESRFTFLSDCAPNARIVLGDARITLTQAPAGQHDLLLLDAFSSDSVPAHLMTQEAMTLYLSRLTDDGIIVFHISNRHLDLMKTVARVGAASGAVMLSQRFTAPASDSGPGATSSHVVILAKSDAPLARFRADPRWQVLESDGGRPWTDDYSNVLGALLEHYRRH